MRGPWQGACRAGKSVVGRGALSEIVAFDSVGLRYGTGAEVLRDLDFRLGKGGFYFLTGPSGAGKTSLLKLLYLAQRPTRGRIRLFGEELSDAPRDALPHFRRRIGVVFQDFRLLTDRNVANNLRFVLKATGWTDKKLIDDKVTEVLEQVGLQHKANKMPYEMSGGEQQRVDIARALLNSPKLILADEPTGNLDPVTTDEIMNLLLSIAKESNAAIVMATHDYAVVKKYPARLIKTEGGKVVDNATIDNL